MKIIKNCEICNKNFKSYQSENQRVCSKECRLKLQSLLTKGRIRTKRFNKICKYCKKEFIVPSYKQNQIYCSRKCKNEGQDSSHLLKYVIKKGHIPWNKGRKNPELAEKMRTGIYLQCGFCKKEIYIPKHRIDKSKNHFCSYKCLNIFYSGKNHPKYKDGKYCKGRKNYCPDCFKEGKIIEIKSRANFCKSHCQKGERSSNYIHGLGHKGYSQEFRNLREQILKRDNYICQNCNMTEEEHLIVMGKGLHVHHIDYNKQNCDITNLITLCNWCNLRANKNRHYWINYFRRIING